MKKTKTNKNLYIFSPLLLCRISVWAGLNVGGEEMIGSCSALSSDGYSIDKIEKENIIKGDIFITL